MKVITPKLRNTFTHNFIGGIAWGLGVTVGLALIAYILSLLVNIFGGLPLVGDWLANIVDVTLEALKTK
jgi:ABC-type amino acid transport system permease subunit